MLEQTESGQEKLLNKVPAVILVFWIIKILSTTVGETAADYLNETLGFGLTWTSIASAVLLIVVGIFQLRSRRYVPVLYWSTVVLVSIVGTLITDNMTDVAKIPLELSTALFASFLAATLVLWYETEGTLSIASINTRRRELFYWLAILCTFALGTAAGDLVSEGMEIGYAHSVIAFAAVILTIAFLHYVFDLGVVLVFWAVYILTRPLGASIGDYLAQSSTDGGLGLGTVVTSAAFFGAIALLVIYLTLSRADVIELRKP